MFRWEKHIGLILIFLSICYVPKSFGQYLFQGKVKLDKDWNNEIYLSAVSSYRDLYIIDPEAVLDKTSIDSSGYFAFRGNALPEDNAIYRLHIVPNPDEIDSYIYGLADPGPNFLLFIANNQDTVECMASDQARRFGEIQSKTNPYSSKWLELENIRGQAFGLISSVSSEANDRRFKETLNKNLKDFARNTKEVIASMMVIEHLIIREQDGYASFLEDYKSDPHFYQQLLLRLQQAYPNTDMLSVYQEEMDFAEKLVGDPDAASNIPLWIWGLIAILMAGLIYLGIKNRQLQARLHPTLDLSRLSQQEQKIAELIHAGKSNKEIADELSVSLSTIKTHVNNIYAKLQIANRAELKSKMAKSTGF